MIQPDQWREILHKSILYGLLFKALALDAQKLNQDQLKMSYRPVLDTISMWAERKYHEYRSQFGKLGGKIHAQKTTDSLLYSVLVTVRGRQEECIYNVNHLKAECQVRLNNFYTTPSSKRTGMYNMYQWIKVAKNPPSDNERVIFVTLFTMLYYFK
ncbi:hypothetical protein BP422_12935 [Brevibacillus formosus]|uniref:Uncharacterized protein n=1 Tax=Brevibacillus formosus TaxID=54913 RepID=A0A220MH52_9BACL|nr:hypothetical protein [Brevibacillus formosus]ASJ54381.1 hypothetical protein BP422_12935 [Brevibacillus formosus]